MSSDKIYREDRLSRMKRSMKLSEKPILRLTIWTRSHFRLNQRLSERKSERKKTVKRKKID